MLVAVLVAVAVVVIVVVVVVVVAAGDGKHAGTVAHALNSKLDATLVR